MGGGHSKITLNTPKYPPCVAQVCTHAYARMRVRIVCACVYNNIL